MSAMTVQKEEACGGGAMSQPRTIAELTTWLRQNSSGVYRPSNEAACIIEMLASRAGVPLSTPIFGRK